jgi:chromosome segregation ATPase
LAKVENYVGVLEKKLKQLIPNIILPLKEGDVKVATDLSKGDSYQLNKYITIIKQKDNEISKLTKQLECQPGKVMMNDNRLRANINFPLVDKISTDKLRELYNQLLDYNREIIAEKDKALESLRTETLLNEEQRNYIQVLKETIDSGVIKHGMKPIIQSYMKGRDISTADIVREVSKTNFESVKNKKENSQELINDLTIEIQYLHKINEELFIKTERMKETIDQELKQLDEANLNLRDLKDQMNHYELHIAELKIYNDKLKAELTETLSLLSIYEKENHYKNNLLAEINNQCDEQNILKSSINEYDKKYKRMSQDYDKLVKERIKFQNNVQQQLEDLGKKENDIRRLKEQVAFNEDEYNREKRNLINDNETLKHDCKLLENKVSSLMNKLNDSYSEVKKLEDKILEHEKSYRDTRGQYETLKMDFEDIHKRKTKEKEIDVRSLKDLELLVERTKNEIDILKQEKEMVNANYLANKNETSRLTEDFNRMKSEYESLKRTSIETNNQNENLMKENSLINENSNIMKHEFEDLKKELKYIREKYEKDMNIRNTELEAFSNDFNNTKHENITIKHKLSSLTE